MSNEERAFSIQHSAFSIQHSAFSNEQFFGLRIGILPKNIPNDKKSLLITHCSLLIPH